MTMADGGNNESTSSSSHDEPVINPAHIFLGISLPFCYKAYQGFRTNFEDLVQLELAELQKKHPDVNLKAAEENLRRAVGTRVVTRAFGTATYLTIGLLGLSSSIALYASGGRSWTQAVENAQQWSRSKRQQWGLSPIIDDPEASRAQLSEEEKRELEELVQQFRNEAGIEKR